MATTTGLTERYILEHPSIKDCLKNGIINYSKLSRKIAKDLAIEKKTSMEAILIACRRFYLKIKKDSVREDKIIDILKKSELSIKNKILAMIIDKKIYFDNLTKIERKIRACADTFYAIEGTNVFTIIVSEKYSNELIKLFEKNIVRVTPNLAMITLKSPKEIETTPGVVAHLYSIFADNNINILEEMSCWTDLILLVKQEDVAKVMQVLNL